MIITVLSAVKTQATSKAGKPYTFIELAYKGSDGQVKGKKVMPFGESKPVFDALANAGSGEFFDITAIKNEGTGYWDWTNAKLSYDSPTAGSTSGPAESSYPSSKPAGKVIGSNYETPEERAKKQVYIVRQSSVSSAISFLGGKSKSTDEVVQVAKEFEKYVFDVGTPEPAIKPGSIHDLENDVI